MSHGAVRLALVGVPVALIGFYWLVVQSSKGLTLSLDLGNALVGIGGLALAVATVLSTKNSNTIAQRTLDRQSNAKIAEFRMVWIDDLRESVSLFIKLSRNIQLSRRSSDIGMVPVSDRDRLLDLLAVRVKIQTLLKENSKDVSERNLLDLISRDVPEDDDEARNQRQEIVKLTRSVVKTEWAKVKTEIHR